MHDLHGILKGQYDFICYHTIILTVMLENNFACKEQLLQIIIDKSYFFVSSCRLRGADSKRVLQSSRQNDVDDL